MPVLAEVVRAATLGRVRTPGAADAIVIGAGATGGLTAQILTEAGLRVLVLDAGLPRSPVAARWRRLQDLMLGAVGAEQRARRRQPIQSQCYAWDTARDAFVDDSACPYTTPTDRPFLWFRARQLGGRLAIPGHGRQYYRMSDAELAPPDGLSPPWPLAPHEIDKWYGLVEQRLALTGRREGNRSVPDSDLDQTIEPSASEADLLDAVTSRWPHAEPILSRYGTPSPFLDLAARTGRLLVRTGAIARAVDVDRAGRVQGVTWVDTRGRIEARASAPLVFLCASALESTRLLMLSQSPGRPRGLGGASDALGCNLMDHIRVRFNAFGPALPLPAGPVEKGRCIYLPRFDARSEDVKTGRGYGVQLYHAEGDERRSRLSGSAYGEMLPRPENRVTLDPSRRDACGVPVLHIDCAHGPHDLQRARDQVEGLRALVECLGGDPAQVEFDHGVPGEANHECGTARMGDAPENSVVDPHNECWDARGLFLTDGACLPSQGYQNPTLTLLALTARACHYALGERKGDTDPQRRESDATE